MKNPFTFLLIFLLFGFSGAGQSTTIDFIRSDHNAGPQRYGDGVIAQLVAGDMLIRQGRWEEAILAYDNAILQWPYWAPVYVKRAEAKLRMGREQEANQDIQFARRLSANSVSLFSEHVPGARARLLAGPEELLELPPDASVGEQLQALQSSKYRGSLGQAAGILQDLEETAELDWASLALLHGNLHFLRSDYLSAINYYDLALQEETAGELFYNRGLARILSYNFRDGCSDLLQAAQQGYSPGEEQWSDLCTF